MPGIALHLVSAPWAPPHLPSIQIGALKAYIDRAFAGRAVRAHAYSAFYAIPRRIAGSALESFFETQGAWGELSYLFLFARRFGLPGVAAEDVRIPTEVDRAALDALERATLDYVERTLAPRMDSRDINLAGFTLNYDQVYSSLFMARYLLSLAAGRDVVLLLGGASAMLPNTVRVLRALGMAGWCFPGEGERKLEAAIAALLAIDVCDGRAVASAMRSCPGVFYTLDPSQEIPCGCGPQLDSIEDLPLPDYSDYFDSLRETGDFGLRRDRAVVFEGSRGCFASCDFCGLNSQWEGFRRKTPQTIVEGVLALCDRHSAADVQFVDNVCDAWAEKYALDLAAKQVVLSAFMELRTNHPEHFWTRLAMAGVDRVQLGVEALSAPLLKAIGKGTRVWQNLAAQKYVKELGVSASSLLMGYHPRSTLEDIAETRRVLEAVPHLGPFGLTRYRISLGSPLYHGLRPEEKNNLRTFLPHPISPGVDAFQAGCWFEPPESLGPAPEVCAAWEDFKTWYTEFRDRPENVQASLTVPCHLPDKLLVRDSRFGRCCEAVLEGAAAMVFDACHAGMTVAALVTTTGLPAAEIEAILAGLSERRWLLRLEEHYLNVCLRPRDVLIRSSAAVQSRVTRA